MAIYTALFSPTGGNKKILDTLVKDKETTLIDLSQEIAEDIHLTGEDICYFAVPSYAGRIAKIAIERISKIKGNGAKAVLVVGYGNRAFDDVLLELQECTTSCGFKAFAAAACVTQNALLPTYGAGRPNKDDLAQIEDFANQINQKLTNLPENFTLKVPGNNPYVKAADMPIAPKADKSCTLCKKCANACPVDAIPVEKSNTTVKSRCIACMRCVKVCPSQSRSMNSLLIKLFTFLMKKDFAEAKSNSLYMAS